MKYLPLWSETEYDTFSFNPAVPSGDVEFGRSDYSGESDQKVNSQ